ncbi:SGNH/GDSL hydrolase family protein [Ectobacillus sp. JY-23]|uniref:SGNH/GDSL hydrolase family protein n=1 Tax=Ectobacillus sp. JY-23 TaxID=2933872 RepID=UPI001FF4FE4C|nr:SGNH/GDSL hydrolase family protein [Ectobacillus sp. JY-23]UOY93069.1 SGNH/GDSL hydrolase family protein [Ectobacillus sp. JY-23]
MKKVSLMLLVICTALVLAFGKWHYDKEILKTVEAAQTSNTIEVGTMKSLETKSNSIIDWLQHQSKKKSNVHIAIFGNETARKNGDVTKQGHTLLQNYLHTIHNLSTVSVKNYTYTGYGTQRFVKENKMAELIANKPNLIIVDLPVLENYKQNITLEQTAQDASRILADLKNALPEAIILVQSSAPINSTIKNRLGYSYDRYVETTITAAKNHHLDMVDVYKEMQALQAKNKQDINDIIFNDQHLTAIGHEYWFEIMKKSFVSEKQNI